jgi:hypothetical protein
VDTGLPHRFPRLRVAGDLLVGWSGNVVGALDLRDGSVRWVHQPTSYQNNHGAIAASPSGVVIGPFGGAVMEVIGLDGTARSTLDQLGDITELRQIGPVVDDQVVVRFAVRRWEASIALISLTG